jgi:hypothetical protein
MTALLPVPLSWFTSAAEAVGNIPQDASSWLTSTAGSVASGMEGAAVALLGDVWDVLSGPVFVIIGAVIAVIALGWAFKNEIIGLAAFALAAA